MIQKRYSMAELNGLSPDDFVRVVGPVFEHSPWIARETAGRRPFPGIIELHEALCGVVKVATGEQKLSLICAHPDLVGRMALTAESTREQASAGLTHLTPEEIALFQRQNSAYRNKFEFPFVICARLNKKEAILAGFEKRLQHSREQEIQAALEEIFKIGELRLKDLITA